jgi:excisionase family DNA binding protein
MAIATDVMAPAHPSRPRTEHVTVKEFAEYWRVSERTVWRDIEKGAIPVLRIGRFGRVRIRRRVMEAYGQPQS